MGHGTQHLRICVMIPMVHSRPYQENHNFLAWRTGANLYVLSSIMFKQHFSDHRASYVHMPYICIYVEYLCMWSKYASRTSRTARSNLAVPETVPSVPGDMEGRCHGNSLYPLKRCSFRDDVVLIWAVLGCKCYRFSECTQHRSCLGMNVKLVPTCVNRSNILQHRTWPVCPSKHCDVILRR